MDSRQVGLPDLDQLLLGELTRVGGVVVVESEGSLVRLCSVWSSSLKKFFLGKSMFVCLCLSSFETCLHVEAA